MFINISKSYLNNFFSLALIARETAPAAAFKDMFHGNSNLSHYGPLASGIPGSDLVTATIKAGLQDLSLGGPQDQFS